MSLIPIEFSYTPGMVTVIAEAYMQVRHIYTDGRAHPDDPDLTYNGNSIGHWEGDTLVVDSVGFSKDTPLRHERCGDPAQREDALSWNASI